MMSNLPEKASSGSGLSHRSGGDLAKPGPGELAYQSAEAVGFDHVPQILRDRLWIGEVLTGDEFAAGADNPVAKRRPDGTHYQVVNGWWSSLRRMVTVEGRREMHSLGAGKLRPSGPWTATGIVYEFPPGVEADRKLWEFRGSGSSVGGSVKKVFTDKICDVLPESIARPLSGGDASAWRLDSSDSAEETITASQRENGGVHLLKATRKASSVEALTSAAWETKTIDTTFVRATPYSVKVPWDGAGHTAQGATTPAITPP